MSSASPLTVRPRGLRLRLAVLTAAAIALIAAPAVQAANATNINIQLPAAYSIAGTIRTGAGVALPGASVLALGTNSSGFAQTDAAGKYKVAGLSPAGYQILVFAPSTKNLVDGYYTTANANHFTAAVASATKVSVGPNKTGIDVKLPTGYTISGTVTNTGGTPLPGVGVSATGLSNDSTTTDAAGKYTVKGLAAGSYKLGLAAPSGSNYLSGWYSTANANRFVVSSASSSSVAVGPNKSGINVKLPTGYGISGTITNTAGAPLANVTVQASSATGGQSASTDAAGKYAIKGLATGSYKLAILPSPSSSYMDGYYTTGNANHFTSAAGSATGVAVGPSKTNINAKVANGYSISGVVTDTAGHALVGASVGASNNSRGRSAITDSAGKYTIKGLSSGSQKLSVSPPYGMNLQSGFYTTANSNRFTAVATSATAVAVGPSKTGINIKLPAGYTISGKITGPGGVALQSASIFAGSSTFSASSYTATDGTYKVIGLSKATYKVQAYAPYGQNLQSGFYTTANSAHFTANPASATGVAVGP